MIDIGIGTIVCFAMVVWGISNIVYFILDKYEKNVNLFVLATRNGRKVYMEEVAETYKNLDEFRATQKSMIKEAIYNEYSDRFAELLDLSTKDSKIILEELIKSKIENKLLIIEYINNLINLDADFRYLSSVVSYIHGITDVAPSFIIETQSAFNEFDNSDIDSKIYRNKKQYGEIVSKLKDKGISYIDRCKRIEGEHDEIIRLTKADIEALKSYLPK